METLNLLFNLSVVIFVIATMLSMGLLLKVSQIVAPLKRPLLLAVVLVTNFLLIPLATLAIVTLLPVDTGTKEALTILSLSAGAPFIPKLAEIAKGDTALATAVMLLLMVATVFILPFALPIFLGGEVDVDSFAIAKSLVMMMIIPLIAGLAVKAKYDLFASRWQTRMVKLSNIMLLAIIILLTLINVKDIIGILGYPLVAILLFQVTAVVIGYAMGGKEYHKRVVSSLSAGQRNISAALVVAAQNFPNPEVSIVIIAVSIIGLLILLTVAKLYVKKG